MKVAELWRYPVKGLLGERITTATLDERGVVGDRGWAVVGRDGKLGSGKTTRRFRRMPNLFTMSARTDDGQVRVTVAGWTGDVEDPETARRVSHVVGEPVTLQPETGVRHHDEGALHLLTSSSLRWIDADVRRFRPNVLLEVDGVGALEDEWMDATVRIGEVVLRVTRRMPRCVVVALAQEDLPFEPALVSQLEERNDLCLGVVADVKTAGTMTVGQDAERS